MTEEQVEGVQRLFENQELVTLNEVAAEPINISIKEPQPPRPTEFMGIDINYVQEAYDEVREIVVFDMVDKVTREKIYTMMKEKLPYYRIKCDEENNPTEVIDNGNICARVTDPASGNYIDMIF
ncbi:MAG: hypothetical protein E4H26_11955 [Flavobacteriales bacterium]|nr:MAG: hypothetical protein E4H26_11955 [Flavobacteriales bacterium]